MSRRKSSSSLLRSTSDPRARYVSDVCSASMTRSRSRCDGLAPSPRAMRRTLEARRRGDEWMVFHHIVSPARTRRSHRLRRHVGRHSHRRRTSSRATGVGRVGSVDDDTSVIGACARGIVCDYFQSFIRSSDGAIKDAIEGWATRGRRIQARGVSTRTPLVLRRADPTSLILITE